MDLIQRALIYRKVFWGGFFCVETNLQAFPGSQQSTSRFREVFGSLTQRGFMNGFMRGSTAIATGCIPAHIALFGTYEVTKASLITEKHYGAELAARAGKDTKTFPVGATLEKHTPTQTVVAFPFL